MSGRRRLALVSAVAGVALVGLVVARRAGVGPPSSAGTESGTAAGPAAPGGAGALRAPRPPVVQTSTPPPDAAPGALTPLGASRALEAIGKNEQTRQLFARLQPVGLSPEQLDRVLLILGTQALRPAQESPTLEALRAGGRSRVLSDEEAKRVRDERKQIAERTLRSLRPALAAVLTPSQLDQAGLGGEGMGGASGGDRR